jgi:hypothetical protein
MTQPERVNFGLVGVLAGRRRRRARGPRRPKHAVVGPTTGVRRRRACWCWSSSTGRRARASSTGPTTGVGPRRAGAGRPGAGARRRAYGRDERGWWARLSSTSWSRPTGRVLVGPDGAGRRRASSSTGPTTGRVLSTSSTGPTGVLVVLVTLVGPVVERTGLVVLVGPVTGLVGPDGAGRTARAC